MPRIPQGKIDEVRNSVNIVDVIGDYLSLQKKGNSYVAICPFHNDSNPSLHISESKQIYNCFVCHNGGNVFKFLQEYLHISYLESVKQVAQIGHVDMTGYTLTPYKKKIDESLVPLYSMNKEASEIYSYYLNTAQGVLAGDYLKDRGFNEDIIKTFNIGYAPRNDILYNAFTKQNYNLVDMENSGLVIESERHYDRFKDRIMFPLHNESGEVVGFSGRIYRVSDEGAKYLNSPESPIFIKGNTLYNYHRALRHAREEGFVYINEGFMDVIAMYKANHKNAIALMGTALTQGHINMLRRMTKRIVLCLDGDRAGINAASKSANFLVSQGFTVRMILLPSGKDPDEILKSDGISGLDYLLKEELTPFDFMLTTEASHLDLRNYDERSQLFDKGIDAISYMEDEKEIDDSITKLSSLTEFSKDLIRSRLKGHVSLSKEPIIQDIPHTDEVIMDKYKRAEKNLLFYMLNSKEAASLYKKRVGFMYTDVYRILASYILDYYRTHSIMDEAELIDRIQNDRSDEEKKQILIQTLTEISTMILPLPANDQMKAINDYINVISLNAVKYKTKQLKDQLQYVHDPLEKAKIALEINKLLKEGQNES